MSKRKASNTALPVAKRRQEELLAHIKTPHVGSESCRDCARGNCFVSPAVPSVWRMREFLRSCTYLNCEDDPITSDSEPVRLMDGPPFDEMANLGDGYINAFNMLSILVWMNGGSTFSEPNYFWPYMLTHGYDRTFSEWEDMDLHENYEGPLGTFIDGEFEIVMALSPPIPSLEEYLPQIVARFRVNFPPEWYQLIWNRSDRVRYGNDLPQHE